MPTFKRESNVKRFYLPSTKSLPQEEQAYVDLEIGTLVAEDLVGADEQEGKVRMASAVLASRIKSWNYTEEDGATLIPITPEAVRRLEIEDYSYLQAQFDAKIEGLTADQKKG